MLWNVKHLLYINQIVLTLKVKEKTCSYIQTDKVAVNFKVRVYIYLFIKIIDQSCITFYCDGSTATSYHILHSLKPHFF